MISGGPHEIGKALDTFHGGCMVDPKGFMIGYKRDLADIAMVGLFVGVKDFFVKREIKQLLGCVED